MLKEANRIHEIRKRIVENRRQIQNQRTLCDNALRDLNKAHAESVAKYDRDFKKIEQEIEELDRLDRGLEKLLETPN